MPIYPRLSSDTPDDQATKVSGLDDRQQKVINSLGFDPVSMDTLIARTGYKSDDLSATLLTLKLAGLVAAAPGGMYTLLSLK